MVLAYSHFMSPFYGKYNSTGYFKRSAILLIDVTRENNIYIPQILYL